MCLSGWSCSIWRFTHSTNTPTQQPSAAYRNGELVGTVAALVNRRHIEFQGEQVGFFGLFEVLEAALTQKREYFYHAAMLDPHTGAELDLDQTW